MTTDSGELHAPKLYELLLASTFARTKVRRKLKEIGVADAKDLDGPRLQASLDSSQLRELLAAFDEQTLADFHPVTNAVPTPGTGPMAVPPTLGSILSHGADRKTH